MSVSTPSVAIVFGTVTPPQGDVIELNVHFGCTKEVSSFEVVLQNWNGKYSPNGTYPIVVGLDGGISVGRGANCPLLLTCRVESVKYQSSPLERAMLGRTPVSPSCHQNLREQERRRNSQRPHGLLCGFKPCTRWRRIG